METNPQQKKPDDLRNKLKTAPCTGKYYWAMNIRFIRLSILLLPSLLDFVSLANAQGLGVEPADIIVIHGRVYTENPKQPWAQAVGIRRGKIVTVGNDTAIEKMRGLAS